MSDSSSGGKYSLETFTIDHSTTANINNKMNEFDKPERGVMSVLTIERTDKTDENIYKCSMTNPFGSDSSFIQLVVQGIHTHTHTHTYIYNLQKDY